MNVIALNGSPRRSRSTTMLILAPFMHGLHEGGARVELVHLTDLTINPCRGCLECWFRTPGQCTLHDEMMKVLDRLRKADLWVFSTGVYWNCPSGLMKTAMDRMLPLLEPFIELDKKRSRNKLRDGTMPGKLVLVSSCAHWEMESFNLIVAQIESFSQQVGRKFAGALLRPHAFALPHMMWLGKETSHVLGAARELGLQIAKKGIIDRKLIQAVSSQLMPQAAYVRHMNQESREGLAAAEEGRRRASNDTVEVKTVTHPFKFKSIKDDKLNNKIVDAINHMGGTGPHAESEYQRSIETLRPNAKEAIPAIVAEYDDLPETNYLDRWSLVHLMGELQHPSALTALGQIIDTPIPEEKSKVLHEYSTRAKELMIRTTAIEAIKRIAARKSEEALKLLLKCVQHEQFSIRRAAVQSYQEVGGPNASKKLHEILSEEDQRLLHIRRKDVREIPQAVIFDVTSPRNRKSQPPQRADEIPAIEKQKKDDSPKPGTPFRSEGGEDDDKPCCK